MPAIVLANPEVIPACLYLLSVTCLRPAGKQGKLPTIPFSGEFVAYAARDVGGILVLAIVQRLGGGFVGDWPLTAGEAVASGTTSNPGSMRASDPNLW